MKKLLLLSFLITNIAFAATMEEIESHFQKGLQYSQQDRMDEAINEFYKVVSADHSNLSEEYYVQTYSEAFFDIGVLYSKKGNIEKGIENLKKAIEIFPGHKRALYYLAGDLIDLGEIAEAKSYYDRARQLGFTGDNPQMGDVVGNSLNSFRDRVLTIQYKSFFEPDKSIPITIKGNPSGNEELVRDTITAIEKYSKILDSSSLTPISVEYVRHKENATIVVEKWMVGEGGNQKIFWVRYDFTPPEGFPYKVMIQVSDTEGFLKEDSIQSQEKVI